MKVKLTSLKIVLLIIFVVLVIGLAVYFTHQEGEVEKELITDKASKIALSLDEVRGFYENSIVNSAMYYENANRYAEGHSFMKASKLVEMGFDSGYDVTYTETKEPPSYNPYSVICSVVKTSSVQKLSDAFPYKEELEIMWEQKGITPEEDALENYAACLDNEARASEILEKGTFGIGDESFPEFYENWPHDKPSFTVNFRVKNVMVMISVEDNSPCLSERTVELARLLEDRLD